MLTVIKNYFNIYLHLVKFAFISATMYHRSFIIGILVELGYISVTIIFIQVIYANITSLGGWNYYEMLFLIGLNVLSSEILLGLTYIFNLKDLPRHIQSGQLDLMLLKPINALFNISFARPYFISSIACLPGIYLMFYAANQLPYSLSILNILVGSLIFIFGFFIGYSILIIFTSFSFKYINASSINDVGIQIITSYKMMPHQIYTGSFHFVFFYLMPIVYMSSIPAYAMLHGITWTTFTTCLLTTIIIFSISLLFWKIMLKHYSSASS